MVAEKDFSRRSKLSPSGDDTLSAMAATLIRHAAPSNTNSTEQLWSLMLSVTDEYTESFSGSVLSKQHFQTFLLQSEMDDMFGFKCIFNGTSSHFSELCWKEGVSKKNILSGDWELGQAKNYMPFQIRVAVCISSKNAPSLSTQTYFSGRIACNRKHNLMFFL